MKKALVILFVGSLIMSNQLLAQGQVVEDRKPGNFDSILLSPDCKIMPVDLSRIFTKTEIIAAFPGGEEKWFEFANKNFDFDYVLNKMNDTSKKFEDSLIVKFIVTMDGNICVINVLKGNSILIEPIMRLLKRSPNWTPALSGSRALHAYRTLRVDVYIDRDRNIKEIKKYYNSYFRYNN